MSYSSILTINTNQTNHIYVVGDLHGCYSLLMQELQNIHFDFQNDVLICTGDLVDRGEENLACISLLDEPWFYTVRGNHEEMCIKSAHDLKIKDIHARNGGEWFYQLSQIQRLEIIERFKQLPLVIEIQLEHKKIGVVHADIDIHDWNAFKQDVSQGDYKISGVTSAYVNALWGRGRIRQYSAHYDVVENIDEIYLGHKLTKITNHAKRFF
ncbi:metallophosphoesterase [Acinetobacter sp. YH12129]|uniref:metallophosphoesterase n=1 Tax=Acinetobacter sp. YH12129 TaxID=2601114 RepID=UPI0015D23304|nr:metallophosphoesterase [Acinetobacter sp. YH12129]